MEGLAGLGINLPTLIAQIVNVVILLGILYLVAYKPVMRMLDERSRRVKESMEQADSVKEQTARAEEEIKKQLESASKEGQSLFHCEIECSTNWRSHFEWSCPLEGR